MPQIVPNATNCTKKRKRKCKKPIKNRSRSYIEGKIPSITEINQESLKSCVINLASDNIELSPHQLLLFYLGKSFAPTPPLPDFSSLKQSLINFAYSLRWRWHFHKFPTSKKVEPLIEKMERDLIPRTYPKHINSSGNHVLELYIERVTQDMLKHDNKREKVLPDNIPKESRGILNAMKDWKNKVIRPADKGSKFFILDREDYIKRVEEHLHDTSTFEKIENKELAIREVLDAIRQWIIKYLEEPGMTSNIQDFINPGESCKPGNNYVNPKAHKPEKNYPGRCISTGCASYIKNLSALTSIELKKVPQPYCIKDTNDLLRQIEEINQKNILDDKEVQHVTFDVEAMFPSIHKSLGLPQCEIHLDKRPEKLFSTECILEAIELTLDHNLTEFNGSMYRQKKGTAMGPKISCAYADTATTKMDLLVNEEGWDKIAKPLLWARVRDEYITHPLNIWVRKTRGV